MAFDGLTTFAVVNELNQFLIGGKINKIYEPNKNELLFEIYNNKKFILNISIDSLNCRINLTKKQKENPKTAPNFCMVLRKYLISSKIVSIKSYNLDRIVIITLESYNELNDLVHYNLIVELMGKHSNVILLNENNIIIDSMRHISNIQSIRNILPANPYEFIESTKYNILEISENDFLDIVQNSEYSNLSECMCSLFTGISKTFINYSLQALNINPNNFENKDIFAVYSYIVNMLNTKYFCCVNIQLNGKDDFSLSSNSNSTNVNEFIDDFYCNKEKNENFRTYKNMILKLVLSYFSKYKKKLVTIENKLIDCKDMEKYKLYGELLTCNLYKINNNINIDSIELENYYTNSNIIIPLDKKISPSYNAKKFYQKYNKLKNTLEYVSKQKEDIFLELKYIEGLIYNIENSTTVYELNEIHTEIEENLLEKNNIKNIKKNNTEQTNFIKESYNGFDILVGKNNLQNEQITFKLSNKNDIWFHVQGFHRKSCCFKNK